MGKNQEDAAAEMNALLSIIVPVHNTAPWLRRCLDSLVGQTYRDLEIICVNDGSTDASGAILDEYAARDARIKVIHQKNAGVSAARNRGLDAATGAYVTFVDADDWVEPDAYEKVVSVFSDSVDLVCFGVDVEGVDDSGLEEYCNLMPDTEMGLSPRFIAGMNTSVWNKVYRVDIIRKHAVRFPEGQAYGEDVAFVCCYASVGKHVVGVSDKLYHYVLHEGSAMAAPSIGLRIADDLMRGYDYVHAFYTAKGCSSRMRPVLERMHQDWYYQSKRYGVSLDAVVSAMIKAARRGGFLHSSSSPYMLELRKMDVAPWERPFHWFTENRECYGLFGKAVASVTYEPERRVYRILGCCVCVIRKEEMP